MSADSVERYVERLHVGGVEIAFRGSPGNVHDARKVRGALKKREQMLRNAKAGIKS